MTLHKTHLLVIAGIAAVAVSIFVADLLIVTEGEKIDATVRALRAAAEAGDAAALMAHVSADFRSREGLTRDDLAAAAEWFFSAYGPVEFFRFRSDRNRAGNMAVVAVNAIVQLEGGRAGTGSSVWDMELVKESDGVWRVTDLSPVRMNGRDAAGWDALPQVRGFLPAPGQERGRVRQGERERLSFPSDP